MKVKHLIIGAGPTGLGAAWRLNELGEADWLVLDAADTPGGLAGSVTDDKGYTWDMGGHIQFSHYDYFDDLMDKLLGPDEWLHHERESWIWIQGEFVPYPFQNNLRHLPREVMWECVRGLIQLIKNPSATRPVNFGEWATQTFGEGICKHFMRPYNFKVWAWPLEEMAWDWIGDRVAVTDLERVLENILFERDDVSWGPNNKFRFPLRGGTGEVWRRCAKELPKKKIQLKSAVERVDTTAKKVYVAGKAGAIEYEHLITTMPLTTLVQLSDLSADAEAVEHAALLRHSTTHIIGLGIKGAPRSTLKKKCWMYFPESNCPFYRATVFSNYSPNNVPNIRAGWSLMCEVSESPAKPVDEKSVVEETIRGAIASGLIASRDDVVHTFYRKLPLGYPTPSLERDRALNHLLPRFEERGVLSRGRFGAWKYEVSNQDHSLMQGVECVNRLVRGEAEVTLPHPEIANRPRSATK